MRRRKSQPGGDRIMTGILRPVRTLQTPDAYILRFGFEHACGALLRDRTVGGPLNVENRTAGRQKSGKLATLNSADLVIVCAHSKCRSSVAGTQFSQVLRLAIKYDPGDARFYGCPRHLWKGGSTRRFHKNAIYRCVVTLDHVEQLLTLLNGVVLGK